MKPAHPILALILAAVAAPSSPQTAPDELVLMTFNIRYGTAEDGPNSWETRRARVADLIAAEAPDVLAIQEGLGFQLEQLGSVLGSYRKLGQHREGGSNGEFSGLYVKEDRVRILRWGEFWLSPTPDSVASVGWDAALPRMVVWAEIQRTAGSTPLRVYGTHFDHRGETARLESARLIARHAEHGPPAVILGDLNADEGSEPLGVFFDLGYRSAFRTLHPRSNVGTFNGFQDPSGGSRIDHILLDRRITPRRADVLDQKPAGGWASDHFPVTAVIATG
ncbi:MAG: endonuclease/exonuclease/phosphatase family protein [Longimicrobiales bacterium]